MTPHSMKSPVQKAPTRAAVLASLTRPPLSSVALVALGATLCTPAHAYLGPGAGLGVIGTLFGIGAAIVLAMFGLLWYPLKRAFGKKGAANGTPPAPTDTPAATDAEPRDASAARE